MGSELPCSRRCSPFAFPKRILGPSRVGNRGRKCSERVLVGALKETEVKQLKHEQYGAGQSKASGGKQCRSDDEQRQFDCDADSER